MSDATRKVYFIGIGGIGMSALARWFKANGYSVGGYDKTATPLTEQLRGEGMWIHFEDQVNAIPEELKTKDTLIVFTPAVPSNHGELNFFLQQGNRVIKRAEALGELTKDVFTIAVAGTHGKTTTSSMIAHIMREAGKNCFAFIGGITQNYQSNLLFGDFEKGERHMVVEADEYDRSFHRLSPDIAVITAMDPDHLDIYDTEEAFTLSFQQFVEKLSPDGKLIHKYGLKIAAAKPMQQAITFGTEQAQVKAQLKDSVEFIFDIITPTETVERVKLGTPGFHNIQNALAAFAVGRSMDIDTSIIRHALETFRGVKRRFEFIFRNDQVVYIDDYAHHPTEITAFLSSVKSMFPGKKVTAVFQPHLFSRTRDFMDDFAESLSLVDKVILLEIYPARELPIAGITSSVLLDKITAAEKVLVDKSKLEEYLRSEALEVLVTLGAGDIDQKVSEIEKLLSEAN